MKSKFSFQYKLLMSFLLISTVPLIIVTTMVLEESGEKFEANIIESNLDFVVQAGINIDQTLYQVNDLTLFIFQDRNIFEFLNLPPQTAGEDVDRLTMKIYRTLMFFMNRGMGVTSLTIRGGNGLTFSINPLDDNKVKRERCR